MKSAKHIRVFLAVAVCVSVNQLPAQIVTLPALVEQSRTGYPLLKARQSEVASSENDVALSTSEYIPKLTVQHQYTYGTSNSVTGSFYPNPAVISPSGGVRAENTYVATWGSFTTSLLEWNVFNFGKVSANVSASRANLTSSQASLENEVFQHQVRTADAYLLALITKKLTAIQQSNVNRALRFREIVIAGVRSGMRPGVDSSLAHAEYTKAELLLLETKRNEKSQRYLLAELSGAIKDDLPEIDSMQFFNTIPELPDTTTDRSLNPLLRLYKTRVQASTARSIAIKRSIFPSVTLVGAAWARGSGVSPEDDSFQTSFSDGTKYQVYNYMLGVSTRWTLTDIIPVRQRFKSERNRSIRDHELYNEQHLKLERQQKESEMQYTLMMEQARKAPIQLDAARRAYRQAFARYSSGMTDLPTLLQTMVTLNRAEADLAVAYSNVWRALLSIAAAKGDIDIFLKAAK